MTSCDYDGVFYRVFCVTLLAIALTFTIILTNVFVDIDGLLTNERGTIHNNLDTSINLRDDVDITFTPETYATYENEKNHEDVYRSKRSLETKNFLFHIKNPQMKRMLTNRLATLLDELDAGNPSANRTPNESEISIEKNKEDKRNTREDKEKTEDDKEGLLHSDIHKVLLRGLIGHMDFSEVYDRVHTMFSTNDKIRDNQVKLNTITVETTTQAPKEVENLKPTLSIEEQKIFNEIMNCKELRNQVIDATKKIKEDNRRKNAAPKGPKVIIKTLIDITSQTTNPQSEPENNSNDNVKGIIKLIYNGRSIKFSRIDDDETTIPPMKIESTNNLPIEINDKYKAETIDKEEKIKDINKFIQEYIKHNTNYEETSEVKQETKRIKRHIKIRYDNKNGKIEDVSQKSKAPIKKDDDELFVEIETHFDSKGTKGEKKKKLIRNLIEKIQKAIHSKPEEDKKKLTHIHVKKRIQDPLHHKNKGRLINKLSLPYNAVVHRHLDPIGKLLPIQESLTYVVDKSSEAFKKNYGPRFLAVSKAINSAEMSEVDVDYNKVMLFNGVPERIQKPLNTDGSEETQNDNTYNDMGKLKFFVKDIDGSGFSVGFNQYVDAPPDKEAMKLFTGLENIIQTYHQTYDENEAPNEAEKLSKEKYKGVDNAPIEHVVLRRSADNRFGDDHHSNEYKIIFNSNFLPYQNYEDIFKGKSNKIKDRDTTTFFKNNNDTLKKNTLVIDEDIFDKNLKPSEIFGLANLIHRKKRSVNVNRISSLKNKRKLNRYLNTKSMASKRIFLNKRRNKRQVNKIRIIATDSMPNLRRHSEEDIFVVSDENMLADRAVIREVETPEIGHEKISEDHYDYISPYIYDEPADQPFVTNPFVGKSRHNALMSKYPHIFMDEISRSKEEEIQPENPLIFNKYVNLNPTSATTESTTQLTTSATNIPLPKVEEIVNAIAPQNGKTNYKLTVKIMPKNSTDMNSGFKEIHTSINKSYNKNGLVYSSLVNVSEISKIVKMNKTDNHIKAESSTQSPIISQMMRQREKMNSILQQQKDRIDEQLKHLNKEKEKLDSIALTTESEIEPTIQDQYIDVVLPFDPPKLLRLTKEEVNKLAIASLLRSYENPVVDIPFTTTTISTTISPSTTTPVSTTKSVKTTSTTESTKQIERQVMEQKTKMIKNIEKNGNLTNEILKKIDRNTEILQAFLRKLTENINLIAPKHETEAKHPTKYDINHLQEPFNQVMSSININNDTHVTIPFVYAYQQQQYPIANKPDTSLSSVIYHGHIHTNAINKIKTEGWHTKEDKKNIKGDILKNGKRDINQTRFFIDELENDFKVIPIDVDKKNDYVKLVNKTNVP